MDWWRKRAAERRAQVAKFFKGPAKFAKEQAANNAFLQGQHVDVVIIDDVVPAGQAAFEAGKAEGKMEMKDLKKAKAALKKAAVPRPLMINVDSCGNFAWLPIMKPVEPAKAFDSGRGFVDALVKRGWEVLGRGHFSTVVAKKDSDKVIKVGKNQIDRDGWIDYALWAAKRGYAGTFAPKVYSFKRVKGRKEDFTLSVVERLDKTLYGCAGETEQRVIPSVIDHVLTWNNPLAEKMLEIAAPGMTKFVKELKTEFKGHFDLHSGNYMIRKDGSFVFSDPVSGCKPKTSKRLRSTDFEAANDNLDRKAA